MTSTRDTVVVAREQMLTEKDCTETRGISECAPGEAKTAVN